MAENEWNEQKVLVSVDIVDSMKEESRGSNTNDNDDNQNDKIRKHKKPIVFSFLNLPSLPPIYIQNQSSTLQVEYPAK